MTQNLVENVVNCPMENSRRTDHFSPSVWGDQFMNFTLDIKVFFYFKSYFIFHVFYIFYLISCFNFKTIYIARPAAYYFLKQLAEKYSKEIEGLKDQVKIMLTAPQSKMVDIMNLIETLERLGISYHFENEIEEKLKYLFNLNTNYDDEAYDLHTVSLHFRLFRQHGYCITSDIFSKFKDGYHGNFKEVLKSDAIGLLSLYQAAYLRIHGENILEEALAFTKSNLESLAKNLSLPIKKQVEHALYQPLHFGYPRLETLHYISIYDEDQSKNESLLKFAKLDYNLVQMMYKQELCEVSRWWSESNLASKLPYARDRIVEAFFLAVGTFYEPRYSRGRIMLTKFIEFLALTDDTYDAYGTIEELSLLTEAVQRWDINEIDQLPEYVKPLYKGLLELHEGFREELAEEGRTYAVDYLIELYKELVRSYFVEAKWIIEGYLPSFAEYLRNALITCTYTPFLFTALLGAENVPKEDFEWLSKKPRMLVACLEIARLMNDVGSYEDEKNRGQVTSGIDSYMMENGVTKEETMDKIVEMVTNAWKDINKCLLKPFSCSKEIISIVLNMTRYMEVAYKSKEDGYTNPEKEIKFHIISLFIDPLKV